MPNLSGHKLKLQPSRVHSGQPKNALALICYNNLEYFSAVLDSIHRQTIHGQPFSDYYDLFIFQDGLQDRHRSASQTQHALITEIAVNSAGSENFFLQEDNLGIAKHFAWIEFFLFEVKAYPFVIFFEHDMILGAHYLEELTKLSQLCKNDSRIGMISMHSRHYQESLERQHIQRHEYVGMGHSWGFGMFRTTYQKMRPMIQEYLVLLGDVPYHERNGALIGNWLMQRGYQANATSQDYVKVCALLEQNKVRVSLYVNMGRYIGAEGANFTQAQFDLKGFGNSILYDQPLDKLEAMTSAQYQRILEEMRSSFALPPGKISSRTQSNKYPSKNMLSNKTTEEDVIAAYKIFLGRFPENMEVVSAYVGLPWIEVFEKFINSEEFLMRKECWVPLIKSANKMRRFSLET